MTHLQDLQERRKASVACAQHLQQQPDELPCPPLLPAVAAAAEEEVCPLVAVQSVQAMWGPALLGSAQHSAAAAA